MEFTTEERASIDRIEAAQKDAHGELTPFAPLPNEAIVAEIRLWVATERAACAAHARAALRNILGRVD